MRSEKTVLKGFLKSRNYAALAERAGYEPLSGYKQLVEGLGVEDSQDRVFDVRDAIDTYPTMAPAADFFVRRGVQSQSLSKAAACYLEEALAYDGIRRAIENADPEIVVSEDDSIVDSGSGNAKPTHAGNFSYRWLRVPSSGDLDFADMLLTPSFQYLSADMKSLSETSKSIITCRYAFSSEDEEFIRNLREAVYRRETTASKLEMSAIMSELSEALAGDDPAEIRRALQSAGMADFLDYLQKQSPFSPYDLASQAPDHIRAELLESGIRGFESGYATGNLWYRSGIEDGHFLSVLTDREATEHSHLGKERCLAHGDERAKLLTMEIEALEKPPRRWKTNLAFPGIILASLAGALPASLVSGSPGFIANVAALSSLAYITSVVNSNQKNDPARILHRQALGKSPARLEGLYDFFSRID